MRGKCDSPFEQNRITRWLPPSDLIWLESQAHRLRVAGIDARVSHVCWSLLRSLKRNTATPTRMPVQQAARPRLVSAKSLVFLNQRLRFMRGRLAFRGMESFLTGRVVK